MKASDERRKSDNEKFGARSKLSGQNVAERGQG